MHNQQLLRRKLSILFLVFGNFRVTTSLGLGTLTQSVADVVDTLKSGVGSSLVSTLTNPLSVLKKTSSLALVPSLLDTQKINSDLLDALQEGESGALIYYNGVDEVIQSIESTEYSSFLERDIALVESLQLNADKQHATTKSALAILGIEGYYSSFSENCVVLESATLDEIYVISMLQHVTSIQKPPIITLNPPVFENFTTLNENDNVFDESEVEDLAEINAQPKFENWGIPKINVPDVWKWFTRGKGVVIANIDTGVRGTHDALRNNWRKDNGWFDAYGKFGQPTDEQGHGTHTMGVMVGRTFNIGAAPDALWVACRGCKVSCGPTELVRCADWTMWLSKNGKGVDVINNSWGINGRFVVYDFYRNVVKTWKAAGILVAFAIGNDGPICSSGGSPGDQFEAFSVGAIDEKGSLARISSLGPEGEFVNGRLRAGYSKPDIVGPGVNIFSAWNTVDITYAYATGTSAAAPHVAATMALMLSYARMHGTKKLAPDTVTRLLERTTIKSGLSLMNHQGLAICPAPQNLNIDPTRRFPNSYFGWGLVNAYHAIYQYRKEAGITT